MTHPYIYFFHKDIPFSTNTANIFLVPDFTLLKLCDQAVHRGLWKINVTVYYATLLLYYVQRSHSSTVTLGGLDVWTCLCLCEILLGFVHVKERSLKGNLCRLGA